MDTWSDQRAKNDPALRTLRNALTMVKISKRFTTAINILVPNVSQELYSISHLPPSYVRCVLFHALVAFIEILVSLVYLP